MNVPFVTSKGSNRLTSAAYYIGRTPRAVRQPLQDVVRHLVTALLQVVRQLAGIRHVDEDVEVIAHEAIRQHLHAGKLRNAPKPFDEARLLLVIQEERAVGNGSGMCCGKPSTPQPSPTQ